MLRIYRVRLPPTLGMLQPCPESQHPDRERQPLGRESQHTGLLSEHIGSIRRLPDLHSEHNDRERLPLTVGMLQTSGVFLPLELGMLRLGGEWQNPTGGREAPGVETPQYAGTILPGVQGRGVSPLATVLLPRQGLVVAGAMRRPGPVHPVRAVVADCTACGRRSWWLGP
jgi:hypothetical protein